MALSSGKKAEIRSWLSSQQDSQDVSDEEIELFLHCCYNNCEDAKKCIQVYHTSRKNMPEIFTNRDPDDTSVKNTLKCFQIMLPDEKTDENYAVILIRANDPTSDLFEMNALFKAYFMTVDALTIENPRCEGLQLVFDVAGSSFFHLRRMNFNGLRKCIKYLEEGMPVRTKGLHVVNLTYVMVKIIQLAKSFLSSSRDDMTYFHNSSNLESLYKYVPQKCLPEEYGGMLGPSKNLNDKNIERLFKYREFFLGGAPRPEPVSKNRGDEKGLKEKEDLSLEKLSME